MATTVFSALVLSAFALGGAGFAAAQEVGPDFTPGAVFGMSDDVDGTRSSPSTAALTAVSSPMARSRPAARGAAPSSTRPTA